MHGDPQRTDERPIRIYGTDPAPIVGRTSTQQRRFAVVMLLGTFALVACYVWPFLAEALDGLLKELPWYQPDLLPVGAALLTLASVPLWVRLLRRRRASQVRAEVYDDRIVLERGKQRRTHAPDELEGYRLLSPDFVYLQPRGDAPADLRQVPTPNEEVRTLVIDWLDSRQVPRIDA